MIRLLRFRSFLLVGAYLLSLLGNSCRQADKLNESYQESHAEFEFFLEGFEAGCRENTVQLDLLSNGLTLNNQRLIMSSKYLVSDVERAKIVFRETLQTHRSIADMVDFKVITYGDKKSFDIHFECDLES